MDVAKGAEVSCL